MEALRAAALENARRGAMQKIEQRRIKMIQQDRQGRVFEPLQNAFDEDCCDTVAEFEAAARKVMDKINASVNAFCEQTFKLEHRKRELERQMASMKENSGKWIAAGLRLQTLEQSIQGRKAQCDNIRVAHKQFGSRFKEIKKMSEKTEDKRELKKKHYGLFLSNLMSLVITPSEIDASAWKAQGKDAAQAAIDEGFDEDQAKEYRKAAGEMAFTGGTNYEGGPTEMTESVFCKLPKSWPASDLPHAYKAYSTDNMFQEHYPDIYHGIVGGSICDTGDLAQAFRKSDCPQVAAALFFSASRLVRANLEKILMKSYQLTYGLNGQSKHGFDTAYRKQIAEQFYGKLKELGYYFDRDSKGNVKRFELPGANDPNNKVLFRFHRKKLRKLELPRGLAGMLKAKDCVKAPKADLGFSAPAQDDDFEDEEDPEKQRSRRLYVNEKRNDAKCKSGRGRDSFSGIDAINKHAEMQRDSVMNSFAQQEAELANNDQPSENSETRNGDNGDEGWF